MKLKKDKKPSAFDLFVHEWRKLRQSSLQWEDCVHLAGPAWQNMTLAERQPYKDQARLPVSLKGIVIEADSNSNMEQQIENLVRRSIEQNQLESQNYYFLWVNYFSKDMYNPAELAAAQFSLQEGLQNIYHTLINPGIGIYGSLAATQEHVYATHQLPLPPNALGNQDLQGVYTDIRNFVHGQIVFTLQQHLATVRGALKYLNNGMDSQLKVYSIECLFQVLKRAACEAAKQPFPESIAAVFNLNPHESLPNISCEFHEQRNLAKHCAKSIVTRWGFTFAANICSDLDIIMRPNRHMPANLHAENVETPLSHETNPTTAENEVPFIKQEIFDEFQLNPEVVDTLNSLDLDNIFDEEDCLEFEREQNNSECSSAEDGEVGTDLEDEKEEDPMPPSPPSIAEELIPVKQEAQFTTEECPEDINETVEEILDSPDYITDRNTASPESISSREPLASPQGKDSSPIRSPEHFCSEGNTSENCWDSKSRSRSRDDRSSESFSLKRQERYSSFSQTDDGEYISLGEHKATKSPEKSSGSRSLSQNLDKQSSESLLLKRQERYSSFSETDHGEYISTREHHTSKSPKDTWRSKSRSRSPDKRSSMSFSVKNHQKFSSFSRRDHGKYISLRKKSPNENWRSKSRSLSHDKRSSESLSLKRHTSYNRTDQGEYKSLREHHASKNPKERWRSKSRSRSRDKRSSMSFSVKNHQKFSSFSRTDHGKYISLRKKSPKENWRSKSRSRSRDKRSSESHSFKRQERYSSFSRTYHGKYISLREHYTSKSSKDTWRSKSRSRSRDKRSSESLSLKRHTSYNRIDHGEYISLRKRNASKSPKESWKSRSRSRSRDHRGSYNISNNRYRTERSPTHRRHISKSPERLQGKRNTLTSSRREDRHISPIRRERSVSPKRKRRLSRSAPFITSGMVRESKSSTSTRSQYTRDITLSERKSISSSNIILPNDTAGKSHSHVIENQSTISTIINRLEVVTHSRTSSIPSLLSQKIDHNVNYDPPARTYYNQSYEDYGQQQPTIGRHNLRHRLGMTRSNYISPTDMRYRIQNRPTDLYPSQMAHYAEEPFLDYGNNQPAWTSYEIPQWNSGYENYLPRTYY